MAVIHAIVNVHLSLIYTYPLKNFIECFSLNYFFFFVFHVHFFFIIFFIISSYLTPSKQHNNAHMFSIFSSNKYRKLVSQMQQRIILQQYYCKQLFIVKYGRQLS